MTPERAGRPRLHAWAEHELERVERCPACGSGAFAQFLEGVPEADDAAVRRWSEDRCDDCRSIFLNPRPTQAAIAHAYSGDYYTHTPPTDDVWPEARGAALRERLLKGYINAKFGYRMVPASRLGRAIVPLLPGARGNGSNHVRGLHAPFRGARLLDVGCGNGSFLVRMRNVGWDVAGIEVDDAARSYAVGAGLDVTPGPLDQSEAFDAITLNHVIEHLDEPLETLAACGRALRPGGTLWISTPNATASGLDRFGPDWAPLDPPRHLVIFSPAALRHGMESAGLVAARQEPATILASRWTYRVSTAIAERRADPFAPYPVPPSVRAAALAADLRALVRPQTSEELTMSARRPG